jgi:hypothetical protein
LKLGPHGKSARPESPYAIDAATDAMIKLNRCINAGGRGWPDFQRSLYGAPRALMLWTMPFLESPTRVVGFQRTRSGRSLNGSARRLSGRTRRAAGRLADGSKLVKFRCASASCAKAAERRRVSRVKLTPGGHPTHPSFTRETLPEEVLSLPPVTPKAAGRRRLPASLG